MLPDPTEFLAAADRLRRYIADIHVDRSGAVLGPDPGVRMNLRMGRFIKSYLWFVPWKDNESYYLQTQGYWILANLAFWAITGSDECLEAALRCAKVVLSRQDRKGFWSYAGREWHGRITSVDGCFGGLGLLAAFRASRDDAYLEGAIRWYRYMVDETGFQSYDSRSLAVNYFSNFPRGMVPNNSTLALWFLAELHSLTRNGEYLKYADPMISFLEGVQLDTGELPYMIGNQAVSGKLHYLCFQYHAFQLLDLAHYHRLIPEPRILAIAARIAEFLSAGLTQDGDARYDCFRDRPIVHYYTAAVAAALLTAHRMGLGEYAPAAALAYRRVLSQQRSDGGYDYSTGNYGVLSDRRSYPRHLAMILMHLLCPAQDGDDSA